MIPKERWSFKFESRGVIDKVIRLEKNKSPGQDGLYQCMLQAKVRK